jgi:uncharacterized damage-inducible protein DinB
MDVFDLVQQLRAQRRATLRSLVAVRDDQLETHVGPDRPTDVRAAILALAQEDDRRVALAGAILDALGRQPSPAQQILPTLAHTRGRLRAALVGLSDEQLDSRPSAAEWAVRDTVRHLMNNEARFVDDSAYAVDRLAGADDLPLNRPGEPAGPGSLGPELPGGLEVVLDALEEVRDRLVAYAAGLTDEGLAAAMPWAGLTVDVRFMLHRRATHERQHTVQIFKILRAIGYQQNEVQMLLGEAEIARGALEGMVLGLTDEVVGRTPGQDRPSVRELLTQAGEDEAARAAAILKALG